MRTIWKFEIALGAVDDFHTIEMPKDSKILSVGNQNETLCIWAMVDTTAVKVLKSFDILTTGNPVPRKVGNHFLGTVQFAGGRLVLHIFES